MAALNNKIEIRRHGDVMIKTFQGFKIPKDIELKTTKSLHEGQHHSHFIASGLVVSGADKEKRYLRVVESAVADHEEHGKGDIPIGDYYVEIKSEYDHWLNESRAVID